MKDSLRDSKLWQQKRNELKVDANPEQDWGEMSSLLDQHLPVAPNGNPTGGKSGLGNFGGIAGIAGISVVMIAITVYLAAHFGGNKNDKNRPDSGNFKQQTELVSGRDSLNAANRPDIASAKDSNLLADKTKAGSAVNTAPGAGSSSTSNTNATGTTSAKLGAASSAVSKPGSGNITGTKITGSNLNAPSGRVVSSNRGSANSVLKNAGTFSTPGRGSALVNNGRRGAANQGSRSLNGGSGRYSNGYYANGRLAGVNNGHGRNGNRSQLQNRPGSNNPVTGAIILNGTGKDRLQAGVINQNAKDSIGTNNNAYSQFMAGIRSALLSRGFNNKDAIKLNGDRLTKTFDNGSSKTKDKKDKKPKTASTATSKFDYGILGGANLSNSLGIYGGVYGAYHINNKWGLNLQGWGLTTQNISGGYSHANGSKVDSGKIIQVTDTRKAYFVNIPLHATYNITDNFSVKAGPVLSIPVKQADGVTKLTPTTISRDTVYYRKTISQINATRYDQQINIGLSGGVRYQYNRFSIEATYLKSLSGFNVTSDYGSYKVNGSGTLNITLGIQLNRVKK